MENVKQLHSYTGQIDDKTVYGVTDYLKEQEYIKMGYYSDEQELVEDEPDICDQLKIILKYCKKTTLYDIISKEKYYLAILPKESRRVWNKKF